MCTAFSWGEGRYFGRNLDLEYHYREEIVTLGRGYPLPYRHLPPQSTQYAMIGVATVEKGYPLFYDGMNEHGLCVAGLHFVGNAVYHTLEAGYTNLAPYELIPYLLANCKTVEEARVALGAIRLVATPFSEKLPLAELHFLISDRRGSIVVEPRKKGLRCYASPYELLTNNPPYAFHMLNCQQYEGLSARDAEYGFSRGLSAFGLPGDYSSASRFVRALFVKRNATLPKEEAHQVGQCFHILDAVSMVEGCIRLQKGMPKTVYSVCLDKKRLCYHLVTYENRTPITVPLLLDVPMTRREIFS